MKSKTLLKCKETLTYWDLVKHLQVISGTDITPLSLLARNYLISFSQKLTFLLLNSVYRRNQLKIVFKMLILACY